MYNNKYRAEYKHNGKNIIIDLAKIPGMIEKYEVIAMYARNYGDFDCATFNTLQEAAEAYEGMLKKYPEDKAPKAPTPLTGKYAKLRDDLIVALEASKAADIGEDGGTCNFDAPSLYLPRWIESKVKQAAEEAGTTCFKWELYGGARYVFNPKSSGQANRRCRASKAMMQSLQAAGYTDVLEYCAMD